ncbi:hypothetical protein A3I99_02140 [Candidatus Kaiserbacteria bacterium RIFCSPLOWO2_02_FULL_45_11b]|uniref:Uncharacterized protein n=1 Tax=Candidatus Kaiserbacteria bacterium RIFCSPLOWO2_12_FULL_45_26 TaxID=1798525 RepID=A0A1F6FHM2_9BACT|nr:MAG: hypothetical protein A2Z56_04720 [Candidatus Kaiserbacteria bacterium RIFCSPHIGHO2_12_45_16]OGG70197.1 MAG: hypothetical protein A2929_03885 [Candidatus Kaiserbacteria bacterium RIFCSPLOWO2_01_FULL_45_25]OGG81864.1 MAG: hypothetical protein A3I99_02140 [Candidatus Kaiserbacteria bacterium RIFCSPLOWO2_02_FULL_45_11b]OGG85368.1 MAG: hypothetical protein A3G90_04945 [Candidatus Kaiserbacteria bacterium RIFCSPLOWO2_12_FULL_45_26]
MNNFYQHSLPQPYHISVGGVLFNDNHEICVHHFFKKDIPEAVHFLMDFQDDIYHLMRESLEGNEPLQDAVVRGMKEEFGIEVMVDKYLGAKIDTITGPDQDSFEKLTIYHSAKLVSQGDRLNFDIESKSMMEWHSPNELLKIFSEQCKKTGRPELDERVIIERFKNAYGIK